MKVSPIYAKPHKPKSFRSILDLQFSFRLTPQGNPPSVNGKSEKMYPGSEIDKIGNVILHLIHNFSEAPECDKIFQEKWDIKDGFWRLDCKEGEARNFCYVF